MLSSLREAWTRNVFVADGMRLVAVESVEISETGRPRARILDMTGFRPVVNKPEGDDVPDDVRPRTIYLRSESGFRTLFPWLLYLEDDLCERVVFFNSTNRGLEYLDFETGETLRGPALLERFPGLDEAVSREMSGAASSMRAEAAIGDDERHLLGDYELLERLGEGGMGVVWLAFQRSLERFVAVKLLRPELAGDQTAVARFRREVRALSRCDHPNVVKILATGQSDGRSYFAMELIEGVDLASIRMRLRATDSLERVVREGSASVVRARLAKRGEPPEAPVESDPPAVAPAAQVSPPQSLVRAFRDAARALAYLHESGVIHRDVKPANMMISTFDARLVLMDLGLAAMNDASRAITKESQGLLGTLRYMAPERLVRGEEALDPRSDVYSLGASFYELLCDGAPFQGDTESRLIQQIVSELPRHACDANPRIPRDLGAILMKSIEKDRAKRYASASALACDIDAFLDGRPVTARESTPVYRLRLALSRHWLLATMAGIALAGLTVGASILGISQRRTAGALAPRDEHYVDLQNGLGWNERCRDHLLAGELDYAEAACKAGLRIEPGVPRWRAGLTYHLAVLAERRGDAANARVLYRQALAFEPSLAAEAGLFRVACGDAQPVCDGWTRATGGRAKDEASRTPTVYAEPSATSSRVGILEGATPVTLHACITSRIDPLPAVWYRVEATQGNSVISGWMKVDDLWRSKQRSKPAGKEGGTDAAEPSP